MEEQHKPYPDGLVMRFTVVEDAPHLKQWLSDPAVYRWFPMSDEVEVDDAVARWISFARYRCSLTAVLDGVPCGIATLYLQPYRKLAHQCEFGIIVGSHCRNQGIGSRLLNSLMHMAKDRFKIELLHLQVYAENPAMRLYRRFGFVEFGRQTHWIKDKTVDEQGREEVEYVGRVFMERYL